MALQFLVINYIKVLVKVLTTLDHFLGPFGLDLVTDTTLSVCCLASKAVEFDHLSLLYLLDHT